MDQNDGGMGDQSPIPSLHHRQRLYAPHRQCWWPLERAASQHIHPRGQYRRMMRRGRLAEGLGASIGRKVASGSTIVVLFGLWRLFRHPPSMGKTSHKKRSTQWHGGGNL